MRLKAKTPMNLKWARRTPANTRWATISATAVIAGAVGAAIGGVLAYFADPDRGRARRARARDRLVASKNKTKRDLDQQAHYMEGRLEGYVARATGHGRMHPIDDHVVKQGIEQAFARTGVDVSRVVVDVADGVAGLRGQVGTTGDLDRLIRATARVPGVKHVQDWLHLPGEPAPNKAAARTDRAYNTR